MRFSIKLFEYRYVLKIFFPTERHIKGLPAIMWGKIGRAVALKDKNT